jgi:eukaryotic-like serine/threonine-protein kinase
LGTFGPPSAAGIIILMAAMSEPEAAVEPAVGTVVAHRWRLVERVALAAEGSETIVYRADDLKGGKPARLELLPARCVASRELAARFDRDARIISRLNHANCVPILDFGVFEARPYLVMPAITGRRLVDELGKPQLTATRAARIATQILEGLRHGHAYGVVHRELGPDKILLVGGANAPDHVKILDFGLARIRGDDKQRTAANAYGCLAPEQLQSRPVDQRADLYAVGVLLRAMASGDSLPPGAGGTLRPLSPALQRLVARAVAKDPEQRFADAGEFVDELEAIGEGRTAKRRKVDLTPPPKLGRPLAALALLVVVVAAGAVGWRVHTRRARPAPSDVAGAPVPAVVPTAVVPPAVVPSAPPAAPTPARSTPKVATAATEPLVPPKSAPKAVTATTEPAPSPAPVAAKAPAPTAKTAPVVAPAPPVAKAAPVVTPPTVAAAPPAHAAPAKAAPVVPPAQAEPAPPGEAARVTAMLTAGQLDAAEKELREQLDLHAESAELHLLMGELFFRRLWRRDAITEWDRALTLQPTLRRDPRLTTRLCGTLGGKWKGAGAELIVKHLAADAVPTLRGCIATATDLERLQAAAQLAERLGGKGAVDPQLLARRTQELTAKAATPAP